MKENQVLYAFWNYDVCPYVVGGEISRFLEDGYIESYSYPGMKFKPIAIIPGEAGREALNKIDDLIQKYNIERHALQNKYSLAAKIGVLGLSKK